MLKKVIAVDSANVEHYAKSRGLPYFPVDKLRKVVCGEDGSVDVLETLVTVVKRIPETDSPEDIAANQELYDRKVYALEMNGAKVIECPAKRSANSQNGFKQSDDFRLMVACLLTCMKLKPDYLVLVGGDGDYRAMVEGLRGEGIRTEVVASKCQLASDLKRVCVNVIDLDDILAAIEDL